MVLESIPLAAGNQIDILSGNFESISFDQPLTIALLGYALLPGQRKPKPRVRLSSVLVKLAATGASLPLDSLGNLVVDTVASNGLQSGSFTTSATASTIQPVPYSGPTVIGWITILADAANTAPVLIGNGTLGAAGMYPLAAGQSVRIYHPDMTGLSMVSTGASQVLHFILGGY
ncbi:MAG: hypothetical protein M1459_01085 [Patescibacteria group bacterium]|nr:hypothetical protein [Patescibacteria group bacterium]